MEREVRKGQAKVKELETEKMSYAWRYKLTKEQLEAVRLEKKQLSKEVGEQKTHLKALREQLFQIQ